MSIRIWSPCPWSMTPRWFANGAERRVESVNWTDGGFALGIGMIVARRHFPMYGQYGGQKCTVTA